MPRTQRQLRAEQAEDARRMDWKILLAYITGTVDQELLVRNEYLVTGNRILRNQITGHVRLSDDERKALADLGQKLGKQALLLVWDKASWHPSHEVRSWPRAHNRQVKQQECGVRIVTCRLPSKSSWLNLRAQVYQLRPTTHPDTLRDVERASRGRYGAPAPPLRS
jgi:hypothetical protein